MKIRPLITAVIMILFVFFTDAGLTLHDEETLKDGGAWQPADLNVGPDRSDSDDRIEKMLDRSFKKSEIVIPPLPEDRDGDSGTEDSKVKSDDNPEKHN